jgi:hypothetical protein
MTTSSESFDLGLCEITVKTYRGAAMTSHWGAHKPVELIGLS